MSERIESELEVKSYLQNLRYAIDKGAEISFQITRMVDDNRKGTTFVMSFHFAERPFSVAEFPYRKQ